jgi:hypothetical protein
MPLRHPGVGVLDRGQVGPSSAALIFRRLRLTSLLARFVGRQGYARLAMETGAPIVPLVTAGAHESFMVLGQGRRIALQARG